MKQNPPTSQVPKFNRNETVKKLARKSGRRGLILSALLLPVFWCSPAGATPVIPLSYTATVGEGVAQGGTFNYPDATGGQLTDGIYGINDWTANLGNGNAYEWVGWRVADPVLTFQFAGPVTITQVGIDFNRTEPVGLIFLPNAVTIGSADFTVAPNAIPDSTRGTLFFDGLWVGNSLTIHLADANPHNWIFVDEITFNVVQVPEPSVLVLLTVGLGWLALRVKRN
jgi:hypothetical protein